MPEKKVEVVEEEFIKVVCDTADVYEEAEEESEAE